MSPKTRPETNANTLADSKSYEENEESSVPLCIQRLTAPQQKAFAELKLLCEKNQLFWPITELGGDSTQGYNDDIILLRYLRARGFNAQAAYKQYSASAAWRRKHNLDETYDNAELEKFETRRRLLPQWTGRRDKNGSPIYVYVVSEIDPADITQTGKEDPELTSIFLSAEYATNFVSPLCSRLIDHKDIISSTNIIDLSSVGLRGFWNVKSLLQSSSTMATAHYPESVERIFVIGAPSYFPTVWSFVTRWFEPATTKKIFILSASEVTSTLSKYIDIEDIPKRFGGKQQWNFGMQPMLDSEAQDLIGSDPSKWTVEGPMRYIINPSASDTADKLIAVGSDKGNLRRETIAEVIRSSSNNTTEDFLVESLEEKMHDLQVIETTAAVAA